MKLLGKGNTAEVFDYGNKRVCKLFYVKDIQISMLHSNFGIPKKCIKIELKFLNLSK